MGWLAAVAVALAVTPASGSSSKNPESVEKGAWRVTLSGKPARIGTLVVTGRKLTLGKGTAWLQHRLVFRNRGDAPVTFDDTRSSRFIGDKRLLAADEGCGWAYDGPGEPAMAGACRADLDRFVVPPGGQERRIVYLKKGLRGMRQLTPGRYDFERVVETRRSRGTANLVYEVERPG